MGYFFFFFDLLRIPELYKLSIIQDVAKLFRHKKSMNNVSSFKKLYLTAARQAQDYLFYMFRIIGFSSLYSKILFANEIDLLDRTWTQDHSTDYGHPIMKSNKYENFGRCGRRNMLRSYLKIWEWE